MPITALLATVIHVLAALIARDIYSVAPITVSPLRLLHPNIV